MGSSIIRTTFYFTQRPLPHNEKKEDHDLFSCTLCDHSFESYVDGYIVLDDVQCGVHHLFLGRILKNILDHLQEEHEQQYNVIAKKYEKPILKYIEKL